MELKDKVAVITGGASGIGRGLAVRLAQEGARGIVVADVNLERAQGVAREVGGVAVRCDVSVESEIQALVAMANERFGGVDAFFSNAGIIGRMGGLDIEDDIWDRMWKIHGMAHVWAARAVVPDMVRRGGGCFVVTASAAGLLNIVETPPYGVTKHASLAFAEWLRIAYGRRGIVVSCLCPQAVRTDMVPGDGGSAGHDGILEPADVAEVVQETLRRESFLALPHPAVLDYFRAKGADYDRWIGGMQKLYAHHMAAR